MGICIRDILVIHDDMDLDFGRIKIKEKGGCGGHRGIKSLIDAFEGDDFIRLRMGIGRPAPGVSVIDYVLSRFDPDKEEKMDQLFTRAREAIVTILCKGTKEGMNAFNRKTLIV
jgi:PTH1 family peptidyl-tRNA hydrolase